MLKAWPAEDIDAELIRKGPVAIVGYGNQGRAHALNLRDSGASVLVGAREGGTSSARAKADGFEVLAVGEATRASSVIMLVTPDETHRHLFESSLLPALQPKKTLAFAHGFSVHFKEVTPPAGVDVVLVAPTGPGTKLRSLYLQGQGLPCLVAVAQDASGGALGTALSYAHALGASRARILETTFAAETETDLFGEQVVVCGGLSHLVTAAFETLVAAGYPEELAYFECVHQVELLAGLIQRKGVAGMRQAISGTARYGDLTRGPRVIDEHTRAAMEAILREIQSGDFAKEWMGESRAGGKKLERLTRAAAGHPMEDVGRRLRALMPWIDPESSG
jgi:ketol-acid reductoisomerase